MSRSRPANPLWKRLQRRWRAWRGYDQVKTHEVDWVWEEGVRYKRVTFQSRDEVDAVAMALNAIAPIHRFPSLIRAEGSALWVDYLKKDRFSSVTPSSLASFFVELYSHQAATQTLEPATTILAAMVSDLQAIEQASLLNPAQCQAIDQKAHKIAPAMVSTGFDYVDAVEKNFLVSNGRLMGIDVEALLGDQWLGMGLAKAEYRGLLDAEPVVQSLGDLFAQQYPLVRLVFLVSYFKQKLEQGKPGHIRLSALQDLI